MIPKIQELARNELTACFIASRFPNRQAFIDKVTAACSELLSPHEPSASEMPWLPEVIDRWLSVCSTIEFSERWRVYARNWVRERMILCLVGSQQMPNIKQLIEAYISHAPDYAPIPDKTLFSHSRRQLLADVGCVTQLMRLGRMTASGRLPGNIPVYTLPDPSQVRALADAAEQITMQTAKQSAIQQANPYQAAWKVCREALVLADAITDKCTHWRCERKSHVPECFVSVRKKALLLDPDAEN